MFFRNKTEDKFKLFVKNTFYYIQRVKIILRVPEIMEKKNVASYHSVE